MSTTRSKTLKANLRAAIKALVSENYFFDIFHDKWKQDKRSVEEVDVQIFLILFAKSQHIRDAGVFGEIALNYAKQVPEISATQFLKVCTVRDRNRRTAGKHLFAEWCKRVGIEIVGTLEAFMVRNSLLVKRFYDIISVGIGNFKERARVAGKLFSSVFYGLCLKDDSDFSDFNDVFSSFGIYGHQKEKTRATRVMKRAHQPPG